MAKDYIRYQPTEESSKGCCSRELLKTFLLFFDSIIFLTGIGLIAIGLFLLISRDDFTAVLANEVLFMANYIILGTGVFVLFVSVIGFIATCKTLPTLLHVYCWLLGIIFVIEAAGGVLAIIFLGRVQELLVSQVRGIMVNQYSVENVKIKNAVDTLHRTFSCCGARSYHDWEESAYYRKQQNSTLKNKTPESCCISAGEYCARSTHPSNINHIGCVTYFAKVLSKNLLLLAIIALVVSAVQFLGFIIGCCLFRELSRDERRKMYRLKPNNRGESHEMTPTR